VLAAQDIQWRWTERREQSAQAGGAAIGLGIGIHTGNASIGEIGTAYKDFTIIGPVVNIASRIQGEAMAGEILVSREVYTQVAEMFPNSLSRACQLKGIEQPVPVHLLATP